MVDDIDKRVRFQMVLENVYDGIQNVESTGSDSVGNDDEVY